MDMQTKPLVTHEEARWLWRCILGRNPESDDVLRQITEGFTFSQARSFLLASPEFVLNNPGPKITYYLPELVEQNFVKPNTKLCLATIAKNEADNILNLIESCAPLIDFMVLVDTGSVDDTIPLAEARLAKLGLPHLVEQVLFEDFSQARNAALSLVPPEAEWILMLDADEEIVKTDYWRFGSLLEAKEVDAWHLPRFNFVDANKRLPVEHYPDFQLRLFRNRRESPIRFVNKVHERPNLSTWTDAPTADCVRGRGGGPHRHHLGAVNLTKERWQRKHDFYMELMQAVSDTKA